MKWSDKMKIFNKLSLPPRIAASKCNGNISYGFSTMINYRSKMHEVLMHNITKTKPTLITSYHWPDIDGIAGIYAMNELLITKGYTSCTAKISQTPQREAQLAMKEFGVTYPEITHADQNSQVILIDTSDPADLPKEILNNNVIAILDHRGYAKLDTFKNAFAWIEETGSAATLITLLLKDSQIHPSKVAANLLYLAIMSNTISLHSHNTSKLDLEAIEWIKSLGVEQKTIDFILEEKSKITDVYSSIENDTSSTNYQINGKQVAVAQLELANAQQFINDNFEKIAETLDKVMLLRKANDIFIIVIDIKSYETYFIFRNSSMQEFINKLIPIRNIHVGTTKLINLPHCYVVNDVYIRKEVIKMFGSK